MKIRWGEATGALLTLIAFVALPLAAQRYLPPQTLLQLEETGLDTQGFVNQMVMLGLVLTALTVGRALAAKSSVEYLILDVSSIVAGLVFTLLIVGAGDIGSLGYSSLSLSEGKQATEITLDLRAFIYISLGTVALRILQSVVRFREARAETSMQAQV
jgi:hypothetical protein